MVPDCTVLKVAHHGHVLAHSDGKTMEFSTSRNGSGIVVSRKELSASSSAQKNTSVQGDSTSTKKDFFGSRQEVLELNYQPCGIARLRGLLTRIN